MLVSLILQKAVEVLLQHNADVNVRDKDWQTPLHVSCIYEAFECAALLCPRVLNIDATDRLGRSALAYASFDGNLKVTIRASTEINVCLNKLIQDRQVIARLGSEQQHQRQNRSTTDALG